MKKRKRGLKVCLIGRGGERYFWKVLLFLVVVLVGLLFLESVGATTYYVDCDIASSGDGSSWAEAFKTIGEGENAATQSGDIVEISGGTYNETVVAAYSGVTFKGSSVSGHNDEVIINATTNGFNTLKDNLALQNVTIIGGDASSRRAVRSAGDNFTASNIIVHDFAGYAFYFDGAGNFLVSNSHIYGDNIFYASDAATGTVQYSVFRGSNLDDAGRIFHVDNTETNVNLYNSVLVGSNRWVVQANNNSSLTIGNSFIGGGGREYGIADAYSIRTSTSGTVDVDYSVVNGHGLDPHDVNMDSAVTTGSSVTQNAFSYFNGWSINEGIFTITVDDSNNLDHANDLSQVLDGYSLHLTYFLHATHLITSAEWDTIKDMWDQGHDIGSHTRHHSHLDEDEAISITYSGTDTNVTATVSSNGTCLLYTSPSPRDRTRSRMPSSA